MWIRLLNDEKVCLHQLRVTRQVFKKLCDVLVEKGGLVATRYVTIKEIVALFLHILAHDLKNSTIRSIFARSSETISRQFHIVLRAMMKIGKFYIKQNSVSLHEVDDKWKWFERALGALDGTLIEITVPASERGKYRDRKRNLSTNVLGACDANLKFTYVLPGWEGSASNSRVLRDVLTRHNSLKVPQNEMVEEDLLREVDEELEEAALENEVERDNITFVGVTDEWSQFRDNLAMEMFEEYQARRALRN
ncbi:hypothetical protein SLA2020_033950 [Shorea laevis]